jgi:predicted nucleic acid-binding Zn finger protein
VTRFIIRRILWLVPGRVYLVTEDSCSCEDFLRGSDTDDTYACKHILAVRLYRELVKAQAREPARRGQLRIVR